MVGRDHELARVAGLLDDVLAGHGRLVLCTGEAGIGKTRLAEELVAMAEARGVPVAWARATDEGSMPPYGLWRLLFEEPEVRIAPSSVFGELGGPDLGADSGNAQRFALFTEVRRQIGEAARPAGLVLVLDDLQWADEASAALLADLVCHLGGTRMLVFVGYRASPSSAEQTLLRLSAETNAERVDLKGLPVDVVADLLRATGLPASREQAERVHSETDGNPFLVRELARMLIDQRHGQSVPGRVVDATAYRLAQLSQPAQAVMRAAAVAGNRFSVGVVARMLDVPVLSLLSPLDECAQDGFVVAGDQPGAYRFSHALIASALVARLSAEEQRLLHTAAADAIGGLYEGDVSLHLAEVARHRVEASRPGDRVDAVAACEAAAEVATQAMAHEEAVRLYRQALAVGGDELGEADRDRLELALAAALHRGGNLPAAQEVATGVGQRAERRRDRVVLAHTAVVMEAAGVPEWDGEICRVCEQALGAADLPDELVARVSARYAQALVYRGEHQRAEQVSRDALAAAGAVDEPAAMVEALRARQLACCGPEGVAERVVLAGRMLEAADALGSAWVEMWARLWRIDTLFETGQLRLIQPALTDLGACLDRVGSPVGHFQCLEGAATLALATGRFAEAAQQARDAFEVFSDMGHPVAIGALIVVLSQSSLHIGLERSGLAEAFDLIPAQVRPEVVDTTQGTATIFPALTRALIHLQRGDRVGAEAAYALAGPIQSWAPLPPMRMAAWGHALPLAIALGLTADTEFLLGQFEPFRGQHAANGAGPGVYMGPVELHTGMAATALGRLDTAVEDLRTAVSICDANGARGYAVQSRVELAAVLGRRQGPGDFGEAAIAIDNAAGAADQLGMVPFTTRIEHLRGTVPAAPPVRPVLSPREAEVASLVGRGLTNKQIAETLYVSERTAENHVQHILLKLGFSNRSQIAAWSSRQGPAAPGSS
jgi:DNA-binding CsgD family transcriptional regulator